MFTIGLFYVIREGEEVMIMDISTIASIISSVGFPIGCCIFLVWYCNKMDERHVDEVSKLRESLDNNTRVMIKICTKLDLEEEE